MKNIIVLFFILTAFLGINFTGAGGGLFLNAGMQAQAAEYKQVQALHILVPTEQEAIKIREEIMAGKDRSEIFNSFMSAAKKYSKCPSGSSGGILGWFGKGDMVPEFETAAFNLPNGQVSEPVKTPYGWHLIYVISKK